jgi:hypothetical protein
MSHVVNEIDMNAESVQGQLFTGPERCSAQSLGLQEPTGPLGELVTERRVWLASVVDLQIVISVFICRTEDSLEIEPGVWVPGLQGDRYDRQAPRQSDRIKQAQWPLVPLRYVDQVLVWPSLLGDTDRAFPA